MAIAANPLIAAHRFWGDNPHVMRMRGRISGKRQKKRQEKPAVACAICHRRYRLLTTPGSDIIYSICPDCRLSEPPSVR